MFGDSDSDDDEVLDLGTFGAGAGSGSRREGISLLNAQGRIGLRVVDTAVKPHLLQALQGLKEELQELKAPLLQASREAAAQELEASCKQLDFFAADNSAAAETDKTKVSQDTVTHAVLPPYAAHCVAGSQFGDSAKQPGSQHMPKHRRCFGIY